MFVVVWSLARGGQPKVAAKHKLLLVSPAQHLTALFLFQYYVVWRQRRPVGRMNPDHRKRDDHGQRIRTTDRQGKESIINLTSIDNKITCTP